MESDFYSLNNRKQAEFLACIEKVGMQIVYGTYKPTQLSVFVPFCEYMDDIDALTFLTIIKDFGDATEPFSSDDLLNAFGKFVPKIHYEEEEMIFCSVNEEYDF